MGKVAVMGAGSWGTAYAMVCADAGEDVTLWARRPDVAEEVNEDRRNRSYLGDIPVREAVRATADPEEALSDAELVMLAVPSHALRENLERWQGLAPRRATYVSLIKGIEPRSRMRASQVVRDVLDVPDSHVVVVSGPNLARECARRLPGGAVAAGPETRVVRRVQAAGHTSYFRVYTNPDVVGVELGGAVKNTIALAVGMAEGMGFGNNTKAMLMTRGLAEMSRLGVALGGNPLTFSGLAGMGDLIATCSSPDSRNRRVGEELARGRALDDIVADLRMVAEGVKSSQALAQIAAEHGVDMPIVEHVVQVVRDGQDPRDMVASLMARDPKPELHGLGVTRPPSLRVDAKEQP